MIKALVTDFFKSPHPGVHKKQLYQQFLEMHHDVTISYSYFCEVAKTVTSKRTIRTGAADCNIKKLSAILIERSILKINYKNTFSIDEKPFIPKKFNLKSMYVPKNYKGGIYKPIFHSCNLPPLYIIVMINRYGIISYATSYEPFNTLTFNCFLMNNIELFGRNSERKYFLFDNATFHKLMDETKDLAATKNISFTYTSPNSCFLDPIEEVFSIINEIFIKKYYAKILNEKKIAPLNKETMKQMICESIEEASRNFTIFYHRACL
ncbi:hypothetical protein TRFO_13709 [Tritrichomonas foetus]|uniref:Tc1-like transposase DDE domain-containing protein n=1 Tax=Tritrichomonas foetus TaxID=1144522 RepID=A0A1J4JLH6_9EUKA|nr:hypothetical protein TRFO_38133 [Tritrichomonas foetus]OHS96582.1 hypothetical protein TRFO_37242 [Tritrichomonas foetus]OHS97592.1 hypothetical protein TRFO_36127 [Tritrichomonas foetus]OHS99950.1 hypothetical protein TRFO_33515 [Tritrichomonas foetus]OHT00290.1 hypothetical protein TRFO_33044 [Tritrichomonas foetus]|eukprot:OHS95745.1 hypothetical protein TRFO_38133 [Tritrichomonas foetus]